MKIFCHNVRVWTRDRDKDSEWYWKRRMARISSIIAKNNPDILCFQELSFPANLCVSKGYSRVGFTISHPIYVRKGIKTRKHRFHFRWDECEININGRWILVINVHLHWKEKIYARCFDKIRDRMNKAIIDGRPVIACGDWNVGYHTVMMGLRSQGYVRDWDSYTFKNSTSGAESKIDFFSVCYPYDWEQKLIIPDEVVSDHRPILLRTAK